LQARLPSNNEGPHSLYRILERQRDNSNITTTTMTAESAIHARHNTDMATATTSGVSVRRRAFKFLQGSSRDRRL
jgi:hypothetical protein